MSYCRICDDSDVYVICSSRFEITLTGGKYWIVDTPKEVLIVLDVISKLGYNVPQRAIDRLTKEAAQ